MAEADTASIVQGLDDLTECSIHCGTYENPRQLPCLHSFCLQCLVNYTKAKPLANNISCPLCRREIPVPADGIEGFPRNLFIDKIIEIKRLTGPAQKDTLCDLCQEDEDLTSDAVPVASMFCAECRKNLCDPCTKEHRRHNKSHSVLKMGSGEINEELAKKLQVSFCSDHSEKAVEMFCFDCQAVICMMCFAEKHQLHKCSEINNSAKAFRKQMECEIDVISFCLSEGRKARETTDNKKDDFLHQIQSVEMKILERSEQLRRIIDRDSNLLLAELKIIKSTHLKDIQVQDEEIERHLTIIASLKTYGKEIVKVGSATDICRSFNQFRMRTKEVQATVEETPFCEVVCRSVSFQSTEFQGNLERNILGKLEVHCETRLVKDLSDREKSLWKTLNANTGKNDTTFKAEGQLTDHQGQLKQHGYVGQGQVTGLQGKMDQNIRASKVQGQVTGQKGQKEQHGYPSQGQGPMIDYKGPIEHNSYPSQGQGQLTGHRAQIQHPSYSPQSNAAGYQEIIQLFTHPVIPDQGSLLPLENKQFLIKHSADDSLHFTSNRTYNVLNIFVHKGNIVDERTQVLVSSADCQLTTYDSVSEAILSAAGQSVVDECSHVITTQGFLPYGAVIPTKAGNLGPHVETILHAIIPTPQEFQEIDPVQAFNLLCHVFFCCLCMSTGQAKSVSFPAIGSEVVGLEQMVEAFTFGLRRFDHDCAFSGAVIFDPGEIHFITKDPNKLKTILETFLHVA